MIFSPSIQSLITALQCLPGVGPKSSQRMALHLLGRNRSAAAVLAECISIALDKIENCHICRIFSEETICPLCADARRDEKILCIVENPADLIALEQASVYRGKYFVLMGRLSPLDGLGPEALGFPLLKERLQQEPIEEVILATNSTMEGEATAHYLMAMIKQINQNKFDASIKVSRIAHGVPMGGELELIDGNTLGYALQGRIAL